MLSFSPIEAGNHPAEKFSSAVDLLPVLLLLLIGLINGAFYKAVVVDGAARLVIILNFSFSALIILYCIRKGFLFSRKLSETAQESSVNIISKKCLERVELSKEECADFLGDQHQFSKEAAEYANTFLN